MSKKVSPEIPEEEYGFVRGKVLASAIFLLTLMSERAVELQRDVFLCFIAYQKAFATVRHEDLLRMLANLEVDEKDLRVIKNLYY